MPQELFDKEWSETYGLPLVSRVLKIKRMFRVSYKTVLYRLVEIGLTDNSIWPRFIAGYRNKFGRSLSFREEPAGLHSEAFATAVSSSSNSEEPQRLDQWDFVEDRLSHLVRLAIERECISMSRGAEILGLDLLEMRDWTASWMEA